MFVYKPIKIHYMKIKSKWLQQQQKYGEEKSKIYIKLFGNSKKLNEQLGKQRTICYYTSWIKISSFSRFIFFNEKNPKIMVTKTKSFSLCPIFGY